jgi:hypothetical protein
MQSVTRDIVRLCQWLTTVSKLLFPTDYLKGENHGHAVFFNVTSFPAADFHDKSLSWSLPPQRRSCQACIFR